MANIPDGFSIKNVDNRKINLAGLKDLKQSKNTYTDSHDRNVTDYIIIAVMKTGKEKRFYTSRDPDETSFVYHTLHGFFSDERSSGDFRGTGNRWFQKAERVNDFEDMYVQRAGMWEKKDWDNSNN